MKTSKLVRTVKALMEQYDYSFDEAFEPVMDKHSVSFAQYMKVKTIILKMA